MATKEGGPPTPEPAPQKPVDIREKLINMKRVSWCAEVTDGDNKFGPPLFDEKPRHWHWRNFRKGFVWGKQSLISLALLA